MTIIGVLSRLRETVALRETFSSDKPRVEEEEKERDLVGTASVNVPVESELKAAGALRAPIAATDAILVTRSLCESISITIKSEIATGSKEEKEGKIQNWTLTALSCYCGKVKDNM